MAAVTERVRFGTDICLMPFNHPVRLAEDLAVLDNLSGGRVELGIGVGWLEEEFQVLGVPWERRGARTEEYLAAMRALWAGPDAEYHGTFVDFDPATCSPRPVRYARSFFGVIDLLSILPTYLSVLLPGTQALLVIRTVRILRVFRVLKHDSLIKHFFFFFFF